LNFKLFLKRVLVNQIKGIDDKEIEVELQSDKNDDKFKIDIKYAENYVFDYSKLDNDENLILNFDIFGLSI
jgi:hypothetical protein